MKFNGFTKKWVVILTVISVGVTVLSFSGCIEENGGDKISNILGIDYTDAIHTTVLSADSLVEETDVSTTPAEESEQETAEKETEKENTDNGTLDPDFKAAMDSYEKFMDEYVAFMKKYSENPGDLGLLADYADYISKYADFVEDFEKWEDADMNTAETAYYLDVLARVNKKLLELN